MLIRVGTEDVPIMPYTFAEAMKASTEYFNGDILAASTVVKKYLMRDREGNWLERSPIDMHARLADEFARVTGIDRMIIWDALNDFKYIVPQGSPMAGIGNPHQLQSLSNCFVIAPPKDNIEGIFAAGLEMAEIQKRRGGVGVDLSSLRPAGARVNNAALTSTGVTSFSDFYSYITRMIGQKGRQGALMITLDVDHPDAIRFATMKQDLKKVTGANVSLKLSDLFMQRVEAHEPEAMEKWNTIIDCAWKTGEPGLLMWDNITKNLPAHNYPGFETSSTNPCAELPLSPYDSCRLISINLYSFVKNPFTKESEVNWPKLVQMVDLGQRMSDALVTLEIEMVDKIIAKATPFSLEHGLWLKVKNAATNGRRTGLGVHGWADMLLALGYRYDAENTCEFAQQVFDIIRCQSYETSVSLAKEFGPFPIWDRMIDVQSAFIRRLPEELVQRIANHGRRNISNLTIAPTGSVAIASQTSSGIESVFRWVYDRYVKITNSDMGLPVDRTDELGDQWTKYRVLHPAVKKYFEVNDIVCPVKEGRDFIQSLEDANKVIQALLPEYFVTSDQIDPIRGVELQGTIQEYIDHGISRTINLPKGTTRDQVSQVYLRAWKEGLKGVTVYVDGSRDGVLVSTSEKSKESRPNTIVDCHAPKRPKTMPCEIHHVKVKGKDWGVVVGMFMGRPYEVFAGRALKLPPSKDIESATITRTKPKKYAINIKIKDNGVEEIADITEIYDSPEERVITRTVCTQLRHGVPPEFIVRDLQDHEGSMVDYSNVLARVLKKYATKANFIQKKCTDCNSENLGMVEGCVQCLDCGSSKCN